MAGSTHAARSQGRGRDAPGMNYPGHWQPVIHAARPEGHEETWSSPPLRGGSCRPLRRLPGRSLPPGVSFPGPTPTPFPRPPRRPRLLRLRPPAPSQARRRQSGFSSCIRFSAKGNPTSFYPLRPSPPRHNMFQPRLPRTGGDAEDRGRPWPENSPRASPPNRAGRARRSRLARPAIPSSDRDEAGPKMPPARLGCPDGDAPMSEANANRPNGVETVTATGPGPGFCCRRRWSVPCFVTFSCFQGPCRTVSGGDEFPDDGGISG